MNKMNSTTSQSGQALLMLLIFVSMMTIVTIAATALIVTSSRAASSFEQSTMAYDIAEAGAENATLRLLRTSSYTGETLTVSGGTATVTVSGAGPQVILSQGKYNTYIRQIQVTVGYTNDVLTIQSWKEVYQ